MVPRYRCPNCGKPIHLTRIDAGELTVCMACGFSFVAPSLGMMAALGIDVDGPDLQFQDQVLPPPEAPAPLPPVQSIVPAYVAPEPVFAAPDPIEEPPRPWNFGWVAPIAAMLLVAAVLVFGIQWLRQAERQARAQQGRQILALKSQADDLALAGDYAGAHEKYQAVVQMSAVRSVNEPAVQQAVVEAREAQERVFDLLLARQRERLEIQRAPDPPPIARGPVTTTQPVNPFDIVEPPVVVEAPAPPPPTTRETIVVAPPRPPEPPPAPTPSELGPPTVAQLAQRPPPQAIPVPATGLTDREIGQAIERGVDHLLAQFGNRHEIGDTSEPMGAGLNVLAVYALLQSGQAITDPRLNPRGTFMKNVLDRVRDLEIKPSYETYTRGLRATLLAVHNRPEDKDVLREDVAWLIRAQRGGAYDYRMPLASQRGSWDNSNSQYGLLGVWSAAEAGVEVPRPYWAAVQNHWMEEQCTTGEWGYHTGGSRNGRPSMTVAGLASLFVTHDYLDAATYGSAVGRAPFTPALARGLAWIETGDNLPANFRHDGYSLYGLERVGLASGFKYFGEHDWYRTIADSVVRGQNGNGGWGSIKETSYKLLFLARGRHPLIMNKLRFDGYWHNRPRDVANLSRFASRELERPINWQIVPVDRDWTDWNDAPILYFASHEPIRFKPEDLEKLRNYVHAGGLIFTQADGGNPRFNQFVKQLGPKLFPDHEWRDLPADHDLFSLNFKIDPRPRLQYIGNGSRLFWVHSTEDLAQHWQLRAERTRRSFFDFGINLFLYAGGKSDLRNRLSSNHLPQPLPRATYELPIAHVRYAGAWNPEPQALPRFSNYLQFATGYRPRIEVVDLASLDASRQPIAFMTGTASHTATEAEVAAVRRYVEAGGTLIVNACGGSQEFNGSVASNLFPRAFPPTATPKLLPPAHPIFAGKSPGMEYLPRPQLRPVVEKDLGRTAARVEQLSFGHGRVIYVPLDVTSGLLGTNTHSILGYRPAYAQALLKNVLLWVADGAPAN